MSESDEQSDWIAILSALDFVQYNIKELTFPLGCLYFHRACCQVVFL